MRAEKPDKRRFAKPETSAHGGAKKRVIEGLSMRIRSQRTGEEDDLRRSNLGKQDPSGSDAIFTKSALDLNPPAISVVIPSEIAVERG